MKIEARQVFNYLLAAAALILLANLARLLPSLVKAQAGTSTIVPHTVTLKETIVDGSGTRHSGPTLLIALRSDGSTVLRSDTNGDRKIYFASGSEVTTNEMLRRKSTIRTPEGAPDVWLRDSGSDCNRNRAGHMMVRNRPEIAAAQNERVVGAETIAGYRTVKVQSGAKTSWYALDYSCALVASKLSFGSEGTSETTLVVLTPGAPDPALFDPVIDYTEGPPSTLLAVPANCDTNCRQQIRVRSQRLDQKYEARRIH